MDLLERHISSSKLIMREEQGAIEPTQGCSNCKEVLEGALGNSLPKRENDDSSIDSWSSTYIGEDDWNQRNARDILDLQYMAEEMEERKRDKTTSNIDDAEMRRCIPLADADFAAMEHTDNLLRQSYDLYYSRGINNYPKIKRKTAAMIANLKKRPHLYCPYEREETTKVHVSRWLNTQTSNPEIELHGFVSGEIYEPKRCIPIISPRISTSDTNIIIGKRKRERDDEADDDDRINKSSSETRLIYDKNCRPRKQRKI